MRVSLDSFKPIYAVDLFLSRHFVTGVPPLSGLCAT